MSQRIMWVVVVAIAVVTSALTGLVVYASVNPEPPSVQPAVQAWNDVLDHREDIRQLDIQAQQQTVDGDVPEAFVVRRQIAVEEMCAAYRRIGNADGFDADILNDVAHTCA